MGKYSQERMDIIKDFLEAFYEHYLRKPYISEIAAGTDLSKSTVHRYLTKMDEEGMLRYADCLLKRSPVPYSAVTARHN